MVSLQTIIRSSPLVLVLAMVFVLHAGQARAKCGESGKMMVIEGTLSASGQGSLELVFSETTYYPKHALPPADQGHQLVDRITEVLKTDFPKGERLVILSKARRLSMTLDPSDTIATYTLLMELPKELDAARGKAQSGLQVSGDSLKVFLHMNPCHPEKPLYMMTSGTLELDVKKTFAIGTLKGTLHRVTEESGQRDPNDTLQFQGKIHLDL